MTQQTPNKTLDSSSARKTDRTKDRKPTGTKGEELSSQGQLDEASRERTGKSVLDVNSA